MPGDGFGKVLLRISGSTYQYSSENSHSNIQVNCSPNPGAIFTKSANFTKNLKSWAREKLRSSLLCDATWLVEYQMGHRARNQSSFSRVAIRFNTGVDYILSFTSRQGQKDSHPGLDGPVGRDGRA